MFVGFSPHQLRNALVYQRVVVDKEILHVEHIRKLRYPGDVFHAWRIVPRKTEPRM